MPRKQEIYTCVVCEATFTTNAGALECEARHVDEATPALCPACKEPPKFCPVHTYWYHQSRDSDNHTDHLVIGPQDDMAAEGWNRIYGNSIIPKEAK